MNITPPSKNDAEKWEVRIVHLPKEDRIDKHPFNTLAEAERFYRKAISYQVGAAD